MKKLFKQLKSYKYYKQGMLIFAAIIIMSFFVGISMIMIKVTSSIKKSSADSAQQGTQYNTAANIVFLVRDQLQLIATDSYTKVLGFNWVNNTDLTKIVGKSTDIVQTIKILPKLGMETEYEDQFKPNSKNHLNIRKAATTNRGQTMMKKNSKAKTTGSQPTEATTYSVDAVINSPSSLTKFASRANTIGGYWVETKDVRIDPTDNTQAEYIFQIYSYICDKPLESGSMVCQDNGNIATYDQEVRIKRRCPYIVDNQLVVANDPGTDFYHLNCTCPCSTNCPDNSSNTGSGQLTNVSGCNCLDTTYYWDSAEGSCLPCPTGTTNDGQYDVSDVASCMCNNASKPYWNYGNKACEICPVNSSIDNTGAKLYTIVDVLLSQSAPGSMYNSSLSSQTYYYSKCVCPANYFLESAYTGPASNCLACPANCSACTSATTCTKCNTGYILSNNNCIEPVTCASNFYLDQTTNKCVVCPNKCLECTSNSNCTKCTADAFLKNGKCLTCDDIPPPPRPSSVPAYIKTWPPMFSWYFWNGSKCALCHYNGPGGDGNDGNYTYIGSDGNLHCDKFCQSPNLLTGCLGGGDYYCTGCAAPCQLGEYTTYDKLTYQPKCIPCADIGEPGCLKCGYYYNDGYGGLTWCNQCDAANGYAALVFHTSKFAVKGPACYQACPNNSSAKGTGPYLETINSIKCNCLDNNYTPVKIPGKALECISKDLAAKQSCPSGSFWCSDGSLSGCFTCPVFPTSISVCTGSNGTIKVDKCQRPTTANSICYGRTVGTGQSTGGWDSQTGLEEDCQCIDVHSASVSPCNK